MANNENTSEALLPPPENPAPPPPAAAPERNQGEALKRRVYIGFAAIMAVGISIAGAYISGRLYAGRSRNYTIADSVAKVPAQRPTSPSQPAAPVVPKAAAPQPVPAPAPVVSEVKEAPAADEPHESRPSTPPSPRKWTVSNPQPGERYLQLAALGPHATDWYVPELESKGMHPIVAPGPEERVFRILIGPFPDRVERKRRQEALDAAGIEYIVRAY